MFLLSALLFGGDVRELGDREWKTREAASRRLEAAGWLAAPALWRGMQADAPEVVERCQAAWARVLATDGLPRVVCRAIDRSGRFEKDKDSWGWVQKTPYLCGTLDGDMRYALDLATKPVPRRMPSAQPPAVQEDR